MPIYPYCDATARSPPLPMPSYRDSLHPWCIVRAFPNAHTLVVARFRRRSDAEAQLRALQRLIPATSFCIVFDVGQYSDGSGIGGRNG